MALKRESGCDRFPLRLACLGLALILVAAALLLLPPPAAHAETQRGIAVGPVPDNKPAVGCTLREAIDLANAGVGMGIYDGCTVSEVVGPSPIPVATAGCRPVMTFAAQSVILIHPPLPLLDGRKEHEGGEDL